MGRGISVLSSLEAHFWSKVWRCTHRQPCKKCCWPWKSVDVSVNWRYVWSQRGSFGDHRLGGHGAVPAARFAYETRVGSLVFAHREFPICHQCDFAPCCNPWHLLPGSKSDNLQDKRRAKERDVRMITFPDGRIWSYKEGALAEKAFSQAMDGWRVWAGPVPKKYQDIEFTPALWISADWLLESAPDEPAPSRTPQAPAPE